MDVLADLHTIRAALNVLFRTTLSSCSTSGALTETVARLESSKHDLTNLLRTNLPPHTVDACKLMCNLVCDLKLFLVVPSSVPAGDQRDFLIRPSPR